MSSVIVILAKAKCGYTLINSFVFVTIERVIQEDQITPRINLKELF